MHRSHCLLATYRPGQSHGCRIEGLQRCLGLQLEHHHSDAIRWRVGWSLCCCACRCRSILCCVNWTWMRDGQSRIIRGLGCVFIGADARIDWWYTCTQTFLTSRTLASKPSALPWAQARALPQWSLTVSIYINGSYVQSVFMRWCTCSNVRSARCGWERMFASCVCVCVCVCVG